MSAAVGIIIACSVWAMVGFAIGETVGRARGIKWCTDRLKDLQPRRGAK